MPTLIEGLDEELRNPLELGSDTTVRNCRFKVSTSFGCYPDRQPLGLLKVKPGARNVRIENCSLQGLSTRVWDLMRKRGMWWIWPFRGICIHDGWNVEIVNTTIEGFPAEGIYTQDVTALQVQNVNIRECWGGIAVDWPRLRPNEHLWFNDVNIWDCRAISEDTVSYGPSVLRPGGWVGGNHYSGGGGRGFHFRNFNCFGEGKAFKITDAADVEIEKVNAGSLWLGGYGWSRPDLPYKGPAPEECGNIRVKDCVVGSRAIPLSKTKTSGSSSLHFAYPVTDPIRVENTVIFAPVPGPLWADWWKDENGNSIPAVGFTRHGIVQVVVKGSAHLENCRIVDLYPDAPEPQRFVEEGSTLTEHGTITERLPLLWTAP